LNIHEIKHIIKTHYEDNFKKTKYASQKNEMKNQYRKALTDLFEELLLRKIDNNGMKRYMSLLVKNEITIEKIRNEIINSQEYFDIIETDMQNIPKEKLQKAKEQVANLFMETLHREADEQGLRRYSISLASEKMTEKEIEDEMMSSEESEFKIYKEVDIIPKLAREKYEIIINEIYKKCLLRKPDKMGLTRYTLFLSNGQMTEGEIEDEVKNSPEAIDVALFITKEKAQSK
tara:strand:- start:138 stop:833 length:696 start_codon:yes stop_codon:yes gene_type:complete